MKSLSEYIINEMAIGQFSTNIIKAIFGKSSRQTLELTEKIMNAFETKLQHDDPTKGREFSIQRKDDRAKLFKYAIDSTSKKELEEYGIDNADVFCQRLGQVIDEINESLKGKKIKIKDTAISETEKQYREWKKSEDFSELEDYNEDEEYYDDGENDRPFIIYDAWDPSDQSVLKVYRINGKTTDPNNIHDMNMHRVDWHYEVDLHYFRANTCTVNHYRKTDKKNLKSESWLDDSEIE